MKADTLTTPCDDFFSTLYRVARAVNSSLDIMQILDMIVRSTAEALDAKACTLRLLDPAAQRLFIGAVYGLRPTYRAKGPVDLAHSEVDRIALARRQPIQIPDAQTDARFQYGAQAKKEGIVSVIVVPLEVQGQPLGVLRVYSGAVRAFSPSEIELLEAIASLSALAIENGRLYERLNRDYQAAVDFSDRAFD